MNSEAARTYLARVLSLLLFVVGGWLTAGGGWLASLGAPRTICCRASSLW